MPEHVKTLERPGYVMVEFDRPPVNVLTMDLLEELGSTFARVARSDARAMLLRGAGKCFSAGADVAEHLPGTVERMLPLFSKTVTALMELEIPTLAYVHGSTLGGGFELAMACDLVVAAENARLGLPEITLGVFPPLAAAALPPEIGSRRTLELLLTGDTVTAQKAVEIGIVNRVGTDADAERLVEKLARHPRPALVTCKRAARRPVADRFAFAERVYLGDLMKHPEPVEGLKAFLEKRKPSWETRT